MNGKSVIAGVITAMLLGASIFIGSGRLRHFDPALTLYAVGSIMAAAAVASRFCVWYQRPASRVYFGE